MARYAMRRIIWTIVVLWVIVTLTFGATVPLADRSRSFVCRAPSE